ncbi:MAG: hypothetical protein Q4Q06_02920 [Bacteroidota bacterium]|nr:hypothetical protein [Bacteroidota bacterium]
MTKYDIIIKISKLWDMCQYWTHNRALLKNNPNLSRESLNDTYALTQDDKEFFFMDYMRFVCNKVVLSPFFRLLIKDNQTAWEGKNLKIDTTNDNIHFYIVAKDDFAGEEFNIVLYKYIQFRILWWWYKLKNLDEILQYLSFLLSSLEEELSSVNADSTSSSVGKLIYHDGFVNRYNTSSSTPTSYGEPIIIGNENTTIDDPDTPDTPLVPTFQDRNTYFFAIDLPESKEIDVSNIQSEDLHISIHLAGQMLSPTLKYKLYLYKNPVVVNGSYSNGTLIYNHNQSTSGSVVTDEEYHEVSLSSLPSLPAVLDLTLLSNLSLQYGDKVYYEFLYLTSQSSTSTSKAGIYSTLMEILPPTTQIFENTFALEFE